ncbi:MAG: hypothetical protein WCH46_04510 [bacterium]
MAQQSDSVSISDRTLEYKQEAGRGGLEVGNVARARGLPELFYRAFFDVKIGRTFLNAGVFSYNKVNDAFGFDFRLRMPWIFYPSGERENLSPLIGFDFMVWPTTDATVSVGIPIGLMYSVEIEHFPNLVVSGFVSPQINLSPIRSKTLFDIRVGFIFD